MTEASAAEGFVRRNFWILLAALALLALAARLLYVMQQPAADPTFSEAASDGAYYLGWARALTTGEGAPDGAYYLAPLYPWFLAAFIGLFGEDFGLLYYTQHLITVGGAALLALTVRRLSGELAALGAALLFLTYHPVIFFGSRLNGESLSLFLLFAAMYLLSRQGRFGAAGAGVLAGLAALARPNLLLVVPLWAVSQLQLHRMRALWLGVGLLAAIAPVTWHNWEASGHLVPISSNAGVTLYHGNGPRADGSIIVSDELGGGTVFEQRANATRAARALTLRPFDDVEADRWWGRRAIVTRLDDPMGSARLIAWRIWLSVASVELTLDSSPRLDDNPLRWAAPLPFAVLLALAGAGVLLRGWRGTGGWFVWSTIGAAALVPVAFYVTSRYRLSFAALLCIPAGIGLEALVVSGVARVRKFGALALALSLAALSLLAPAGEIAARGEAAGLVQRAWARRQSGDLAAAEDDLRRALEANPLSAPARVQMGLVLEATGRGGEAETIYREALRVQPRYAAAACLLGQRMRLDGRSEEALEILREGLALEPLQELCWNNLIASLADLGRGVELERELERARVAGVTLSPRLTVTLPQPPAAQPSGDGE